MKRILFFLLSIISLPQIIVFTSGCGQIMTPTGGPRDSIPPKLISTNPVTGATNFKGNRITLIFNEYIQLQELQQNLIVSPTPVNNPYIDYKLKNVTIKLRDTLEPNTTYTINLGNAIRDINENNIIRDFRYVFSTGATLDSLDLSGKVEIAETGKTDSTLIVLLYKNHADSAVIKQKPKYIARLNNTGVFTFSNLAPGAYKIYALKDADGSRNYNSKTEIFAFADTTIIVSNSIKPVNLFAYAELTEKPKGTAVAAEKKLRYTTKIVGEKQSIINDLTIEFNNRLKNFDKQKIFLTDTFNKPLQNVNISIDTAFKKITISNKWKQDEPYRLIILKDFATDTSGNSLAKSDTLRFTTKSESDYGNIRLKFTNFDKSKNPVLQFVINNEVILSYPLTDANWNAPLFEPGEYEMRILYDDNKNGRWDAGNFAARKQPEKVYSVPQKLAVRQNFEKDVIIEL